MYSTIKKYLYKLYIYTDTLLINYLITSIPPMYGLNATGTFIVPSSFKLFSRNAINILGGATTVLFNVCAKYFPSFTIYTNF